MPCRDMRGSSIAKLKVVAELQSVFRDAYHFKTEEWQIPTNRSHNLLAFKLTKYLEDHEKKDSLLKVYYGSQWWYE